MGTVANPTNKYDVSRALPIHNAGAAPRGLSKVLAADSPRLYRVSITEATELSESQ